MPNSEFQNRLKTFIETTRQVARAADTRQGLCSHDGAAHDEAETALSELFKPGVRDEAEELIGEIFYHVSTIEQLHAKALKPVRLTRERTIDAQVAKHESATKPLVAKLEALLS